MVPGPFDAPSKSVANETPSPRSPVWHEIVMDHPRAIMLVDGEGVVRFANHAAHDLFGHAAGDLYGSMLPPPLDERGETEIGILRADKRPCNVKVRQDPIQWQKEPLKVLFMDEVLDEPTETGPVLFEEEPEPLVPDALDFEDAPSALGEHVLTDPLDQLLGTRRTRLKLPRTHRTYIRSTNPRKRGP